MLTRTNSPSDAPLRGRFYLGARIFVGLGLVALAASWLAANHYPPWTSFHGEAAAFASLTMLCASRSMFSARAQFGLAPIPGLLALLLIALQWVSGQIVYGGDALVSGMYLAGAALAWWLGTSSLPAGRTQRDPLAWLSATLVSAAAVSVLIAAFQWLRLEPALGIFAADRGPEMRPFGNLAQPNHLATLSLMATVLALWLYSFGRLKLWQLALLLVWFSFGLTLTESRSGLLGAFAAGSLILVAGRRVGAPGLVRPIMVWWVMLLLAAWAWAPLNDVLYLQPSRAAQLTNDSARLTMWKQCLAAIEASPWWGYGWRQTMLAQKMAALEVPGGLATDYAHNIVLDLLIWAGVPLGFAIVAGATWWLVRATRRLSDLRQVFLLAATVPVIVHSLFEFPFAYAYFLFPTAWLLGQLAVSQGPALPQLRSERDARPWMFALVIAYGSLALALASEYLKVEEDYRVMRFELRRVGRTPAEYERPQLQLLTQLDALLKLGRLAPKPGMDPHELERLRLASERNGWATLDLSYAAALALNGQPKAASRQLASIEAVYGPESGRQAIGLFRQLKSTYPQLKEVVIPLAP